MNAVIIIFTITFITLTIVCYYHRRLNNNNLEALKKPFFFSWDTFSLKGLSQRSQQCLKTSVCMNELILQINFPSVLIQIYAFRFSMSFY